MLAGEFLLEKRVLLGLEFCVFRLADEIIKLQRIFLVVVEKPRAF